MCPCYRRDDYEPCPEIARKKQASKPLILSRLQLPSTDINRHGLAGQASQHQRENTESEVGQTLRFKF